MDLEPKPVLRVRAMWTCCRGPVPKWSRIWHTENMSIAVALDSQALAYACQQYGVARLRIFGSAVTERFDPAYSDIDFLVDFLREVHDLLGNYLGLKEELARIIGRKVDLVMPDAVENPYFAAKAFATAEDVYAA